MSNRLLFRPDLAECILEDRTLLAIASLGIIIRTTSGLVLVTPFPGANPSEAGTLGSNSPGGTTADAVNGLPIPRRLYIRGSGAVSNLHPGDMAGLVSLMGDAGATDGASVSLRVGSGLDTSGPTANTTRTAAAVNLLGGFSFADPTERSTLVVIGINQSGPASDSPVLPRGQSYRAAPAAARSSAPQNSTFAQPEAEPGATGTGLPFDPNQRGKPMLGTKRNSRGAPAMIQGARAPSIQMLFPPAE